MTKPRATIVLPLLCQREDWLRHSALSALNQTVPVELLVIVSPRTPAGQRELLQQLDPGRSVLRVHAQAPRDGLANALNTGFALATTERIGMLFSDDWLLPAAVERCLACDADIVATGQLTFDAQGDLSMSRRLDFQTYAALPTLAARAGYLSHFFLFRRRTLLALGGVDETIGSTGPDDFDMIWSLLERGGSVGIVNEPLYCYRDHAESRLTLYEPAGQIRDMQKILNKHGVSGRQRHALLAGHARWFGRTLQAVHGDTAGFEITHALTRGVAKRGTRASPAVTEPGSDLRWWHGERAAFARAGFRMRDYFPHRVLYLRKAYPDTGHVFANAGFPHSLLDGNDFLQVNLYAEAANAFSGELWRHGNLHWHRQQLGHAGLVAAAGLWMLDGERLFVSLLQSDLMQQLFRHPEFCAHKTHLENRFGGWHKLLLNAILALARRLNVKTVFIPTAATVLQRTRKRVQPGLFRRIYDHPASHYSCRRTPVNGADYWAIGVAANQARIAPLEPVTAALASRRTLCLMHDIEGDVDTDVPLEACEQNLRHMLAIEKAAGVRGTYNILGTRFARSAQTVLDAGDHALGFHSYNHRLEDLNQLPQVRGVDLQVKGYRPPRSMLTPELTDENLHRYNFEWLATSRFSLGYGSCRLERGVVKIPIATDDFPLHRGDCGYDAWAHDLLESARQSGFFAFSLHDCYAQHWLHGYEELLRSLARLGEFRTADEVAAELFLRSSATV